MAAKKKPPAKKNVKDVAKKVTKKSTSKKAKPKNNAYQDRPDVATRFQKGNQMWKKRSKHGRDKIISSPELLEECLIEYLDSLEHTPFFEEKSHQFQGMIVRDAVARRRPPTLAGFCVFIGICTNTFDNLKKTKDPDFLRVIQLVEDIFFDEKFAGAASGVYNANIISRDLGLKDRSDVTTNDNDIPGLSDFYGGTSED